MRKGTELYQLLNLLKGVESKAQTHTPHRLVGRGPDGVELLQAIEGACPVRGDLGTQRQGAISLSPTRSRARGVTGLPSVAQVVGGVMRLETHTPPLLERGVATEVVLTGVSLPIGLAFDYLVPTEEDAGWAVHPHVRVLEVERVTPVTYRLLVEVDPEAPLLVDAPIAYGQGVSTPVEDPVEPTEPEPTEPEGTQPETTQSALPHRAESLYGITVPQAEPAFLSYAYDGEVIIAGRYADEGSPLAPIGQVSSTSWNPVWASPIWGAETVADGSLAMASGSSVEVVDFENDITYRTTDFQGDAVSAAYVNGALHWVTVEPATGLFAAVHLYRAPPTLDAEEVEPLASGEHVAANNFWLDAIFVGWEGTKVHIARAYFDGIGQQAVVATFGFDGSQQSGRTTSGTVGTGWPSQLGSLRTGQYLLTGGEDGATWIPWTSPSWPESMEEPSVAGGPSSTGLSVCFVRNGRLLFGPIGTSSAPSIDIPFQESPDWPKPDLIFPLGDNP